MPVRIVGMIGVTPPRSDATLHIIEGGLSPDYVVEAARAHEASGFDLVLVGYSSSSAEGFLVALHAASHTERLGYLIAHRPGFVAPTLMARKIATFDHLTGGRLAMHIITGKTDNEQEGDGDFTPKAERYRRAEEYLELMKLAWSNERAFRFCRRVLSRQWRTFRCAPAAKAASAVVLRRRFRRRADDGRAALRRLCDLCRAAEVDARAHGPVSRPGRRLRTGAGFQRFGAPDHCGDRRRRVGQGEQDSCGDAGTRKNGAGRKQ